MSLLYRLLVLLLAIIGPVSLALGQATSGDKYVDSQIKALKSGLAESKKVPPPVQSVRPATQAPLIQKALDTLTTSQAGASKVINAKVEPIVSGISLKYDFPDLVGAAAFVRGDQLIVTWTGEAIIAHPPLEAISGDRVRQVERLTSPGSTVLRFMVRPGVNVGMRREGNVWILEVKDRDVLPRELVTVEPQADPVAGSRLYASLADPTSVIQLIDPVDGGNLFVVPARAASAGVLSPLTYPGGRVLPSAQGLVVQPYGDRVQVIKYANGVALMGLERERPAEGVATRGYFEKFDGTVGRERLINLKEWAGDQNRSYSDRKGDLLYDVSTANDANRQERRWKLARFYLGNADAASAVGVLDLMAQTDPDLLNAPPFRALRGVARLKLHQYQDAYDDLGHPLLDSEPEMSLWRTLALEGLERSVEAVGAFANGSDVLALYDPEQQAQFRLSAVRSDIKSGGTNVAARELGLLSDKSLPSPIRAEIAFWRGKLALAGGDRTRATAEFNAAKAIGDRRVGAWATLALTEDDIQRKAITPAQAIDRLDRLRFAWRGDAFELDLLDRLSLLYLQTGQVREALSSMRQAVNYFRPSEKTRQIASQMDTVFRQLFLDGGADPLPPIKALAIYYDFRELTPLGSDGDAMIRRLADRLVSVDLLDRAAGLLEHQVKYRLEGAAQAQVAARLAMVYVMSGAPDKAIGALRATRQVALPDDVRIVRNTVEARALIDLGRPDEAEVLLDGINSPEVQLLRSDVYWKQKDWAKLSESLKTLLPSPNDSLTDDQKRLVLRAAVAKTMLSDNAGLTDLRKTYLGAMGRDSLGAAFDVISSEDTNASSDLGALTKTLAEIDKIDGFVKKYKAAFAADAAKPAATASAPTPAG